MQRTRREGWARLTAFLLVGIVFLLVVFSLVLFGMNHLRPERLLAEFLLASILTALSSAVVGGLIVALRPENRVGWLLCWMGLLMGGSAVLQQYVRYAMVTNPGNLPLGPEAAWLNRWTWYPVMGLLVLVLPLIFPTGRLISPRWRLALALAAGAVVVLSAGGAISPGPQDASLPEVGNPYVPAWSADALTWLIPLGAVLVLASLLCAAAAPVVRARQAGGIQRQQVKWFAYSVTVLVGVMALPLVIDFQYATQDTRLSGALLAVALPLLPVSIGAAVLRYRLYDIDVLIRRTLAYTLLTAVLAVIYFGSVVVLQSLLHALSGANGDLAIIFSTLAIAALFNPLRMRIQRLIDRRFFRQKYDAGQVLASFSAAASSEVDLGRLSGQLLKVVDESLQVESLALWMVKNER